MLLLMGQHFDGGVNQQSAEDVNHKFELGYQLYTYKDEYKPHNNGA